MNYVLSRLAEPSSHAGIAATLQAAKLFFPPQYAAVFDGAAVFFGSLAFALQEKSA